MLIEERIREEQQKCLNDYCKTCSGNCCNSRKYRIFLDSSSVSLFQEYGIPVIKTSQLDKFLLKANKFILKDGSPVQQPVVIEISRILFKPQWYLYADFCPFYEKEEGCRVHEDTRRPQVCEDYPIHFLGYDEKGKFDVRVMESCTHRTDLISSLAGKFPLRVVD